MALVDRWRRRGTTLRLEGFDVFVVDVAAAGPEREPPLLVVHGFPTSSFDFHDVVEGLARGRRVVLLDLLGYGLSAKPDMAYTVDRQADVVVAMSDMLDLSELALLTHDMGDTVGGELLARQMEGRWPVEITRRVVTNGSIYIEMAQLSAGQLLLLDLPDEALPATGGIEASAMAASLAATFSPASTVDADELAAMCALVAEGNGQRLLPRLVRYIEERRRHQDRFTGAIERHPSPLAVVWGVDDPIAVVDMARRLGAARPDAPVTLLEGVGHYPMVEAPARFLDAVLDTLG